MRKKSFQRAGSWRGIQKLSIDINRAILNITTRQKATNTNDWKEGEMNARSDTHLLLILDYDMLSMLLVHAGERIPSVGKRVY